MRHNLKIYNNIYYIEYENGKCIELTRDNKHFVVKDNNYAFVLLDNDLDKVFDINNKRFITKSIDMKILYNNYKQAIKREKKRL